MKVNDGLAAGGGFEEGEVGASAEDDADGGILVRLADLVLLIVLGVVELNCLRIARANLVESLKNE